jgi:energy-converting hydrogenase A subunit M
MTPEQHAERSGQLLGQFDEMDTGDVISILATALQMAVCYGAQTREDAMDMVACLMVDIEHDMPRLYDFVQDRRAKSKGN